MQVQFDRFKVGLPELDNDHQKLFKMLSEAYSLLDSNQVMIAHHSLEELNDYLVYHCNMEEALMKRYGIPFINVHKTEHQRLREIVLDTVTTILRHKDLTSTKLPKFALAKLQTALEDHITNYSTKIANYICTHKVAA